MKSKYKKTFVHEDTPCHYCRVKMSAPKANIYSDSAATIDHVIPQTKDGPNTADNIVIACARCNGLKGHTSYEIFIVFARVVIKQYPNAPTTLLRLALRQFIDSLAEIAIRNTRESNRAVGNALLSLADNLKER